MGSFMLLGGLASGILIMYLACKELEKGRELLALLLYLGGLTIVAMVILTTLIVGV